MAEEELSTGWEDGVAAEDTILRGAVLSLADRIVRFAKAAERPLVNDNRLAGGWIRDAGVFTNMAVVPRPPADWNAITTAVDELAPRGVPIVLMSPWPTPDFRGDGLVLIGHPPFMVRPAGGQPAASVPAGLEIVEVTDGASMAMFDRALLDGYPLPGVDPGYFIPAMLGGRGHFFVGLVDGQPVATAASHLSHGVQQVEFVSTMPEARGRGYGGAVTAAASVVDPALPAVLISSDDGRSVYERLGYLPISRWTLWLRP